jgi:hypothetical protein
MYVTRKSIVSPGLDRARTVLILRIREPYSGVLVLCPCSTALLHLIDQAPRKQIGEFPISYLE